MKNNKVAILSIPIDFNASFSFGAANGPAVILESLQHGSLNKSCENSEQIHLQENVTIEQALTTCDSNNFVSSIESYVSEQLQKGIKPLVLGGDHSISYPVIKAIHQRFGQMTIIHLDAHSDLYHEYKGNPYSNACPFARVMENKLANNLYQYGVRTLTEHQREQAKKFNVQINEMRDWPTNLPEIDGPVYLSIDVDAIDPAFAPGVSHKEPGGLTTREVINIIHQLKGNLVGADIVEFNPTYDIANQTAYVAAKLAKECIGKLLQSTKQYD